MKKDNLPSSSFLAFFDWLTIRGIYAEEHRRRHLVRALRAAAFSMAVFLLERPAFAAGNLPEMSAGYGTGMTVSGNTLTIDSTAGSSFNWDKGFNIGSGYTVQFNGISTAVNKDTSGNPSDIFGSLKSAGAVYILNPHGILFGAGCQVDVNGLVAAACGSLDEDTMTFSKVGGDVKVEGTVNAGAFAYLVGKTVTGSVNADEVALVSTGDMAAGDTVTIAKDENGATIQFVYADESGTGDITAGAVLNGKEGDAQDVKITMVEGRNLSISGISGATSLEVETAGNITQLGDISVAGSTSLKTTGGDITLSKNTIVGSIDQTKTPPEVGESQTLTLDATGNIILATGSKTGASGEAKLAAGKGILLGGSTQEGDVTVAGAQLGAGGALTLEAKDGSIALGKQALASTYDALTLTGAKGVAMDEGANAESAKKLTATATTGDIVLGSKARLGSSDALTLAATDGSVKLGPGAIVISTGALSATAKQDFVVNGSVKSKDVIELTATDGNLRLGGHLDPADLTKVTEGSVKSLKGVKLTAGDSVVLEAGTLEGTDLTASAGRNVASAIDLSGLKVKLETTTEGATLTADEAAAVNLLAGSELVSEGASAGVLVLGNLTAAESLDVTTKGDIVLSKNTIVGTIDQTKTPPEVGEAKPLVLDASGNITLAAGSKTGASGTATLTAGKEILLEGSSQSGDVTIAGAQLGAGGALTLEAKDGSISLGKEALASTYDTLTLTGAKGISLAEGARAESAKELTASATTGDIVLGSGARLGSSDALALTAADGSVKLAPGAILISSGALSATAKQDLVVNGSVESKDAINLTATEGNLRLGGHLDPADLTKVTEGSVKSLKEVTLTAGDSVVLEAGTLEGTDLTASAGRNVASAIDLSGPKVKLETTTEGATLTADEAAAVNLLAGSELVSEGDSAGVLVLGTLSATESLAVTTKGDLKDLSLGKIISEGETTLEAASVDLANAENDFGGTVALTTTGGATLAVENSLTLSASTVGGALKATAAGAIASDAKVTVTGETTLNAESVDLANAENDFGGAVALTTTGNATLADANDLTLSASTVGGSLKAVAAGDLTVSDETTAEKDMLLEGNNVTVTETVKAGGSLEAVAAGDLKVSSKATAGKNMLLEGNNVTVAETVEAGGSLGAVATGNLKVFAKTTAKKNMLLEGKDITVAETVKAGENLELHAAKNVTESAEASAGKDKLVVSDSGDIAVKSGFSAQNAVYQAKKGSAKVNLGDVSAAAVGIETKGDITVQGSPAAQKLVLKSTDGSVTATSLDKNQTLAVSAKKNATISSSKNIAIADGASMAVKSVSPDGTLGKDVSLSVSGVSAGNNAVVTTKRNLSGTSVSAKNGTVTVDVAGDANLNVVSAGSTANLDVDGSATVGSISAGGLADLIVKGSLDASSIKANRLVSQTGDLSFGSMEAGTIEVEADNIEMGEVSGKEALFTANGSVSDNKSNVVVDDLTMDVSGDIGSKGSPINTEVGTYTSVSGKNVYLNEQAQNKDVNIGSISASGDLSFAAKNVGGANGSMGGLVNKGGSKSNPNFSSGGDMTLDVGGTIGSAANHMFVKVNDNHKLTVQGGNMNAALVPGDYVHAYIDGYGRIPEYPSVYGLLIVDNMVVGGSPKLVRAMNRALAFSVSTPELKSTQGVFGEPGFLVEDMEVSEVNSMGVVDRLSLDEFDTKGVFINIGESKLKELKGPALNVVASFEEIDKVSDKTHPDILDLSDWLVKPDKTKESKNTKGAEGAKKSK